MHTTSRLCICIFFVNVVTYLRTPIEELAQMGPVQVGRIYPRHIAVATERTGMSNAILFEIVQLWVMSCAIVRPCEAQMAILKYDDFRSKYAAHCTV